MTSGYIPTTWYDYVLASAGTIYDENTTGQNPVTNTTPATESICPKGWTLPSATQIRTIGNNTSTYASSFSSVYSGYYYNTTLADKDTRSYWWGSEATTNAAEVKRYSLYYNNNNLITNTSMSRRNGLSIRCINKQKTVLDLTYMQEMTPEIASNTLDGTTATLTDRRDGTEYRGRERML